MVYAELYTFSSFHSRAGTAGGGGSATPAFPGMTLYGPKLLPLQQVKLVIWQHGYLCRSDFRALGAGPSSVSQEKVEKKTTLRLT